MLPLSKKFPISSRVIFEKMGKWSFLSLTFIGFLQIGFRLLSYSFDTEAYPGIQTYVTTLTLCLSIVIFIDLLRAVLWWKRFHYMVRDGILEVESGVISKSLETVTFARMNAIHIRRTLFDALLYLRRLEIIAPGVKIEILGLPPRTAHALMEELEHHRSQETEESRIP